MNNFQQMPLKLYVQDIFRATRTPQNKYIYEIFNLTFKNIEIHGVVTSVSNATENTINFEISDATGTISVYYDSRKANSSISKDTLKDLTYRYVKASKFGDENLNIMTKMMETVKEKHKNPISIIEGDFVRVIGDIFVDNLREVRMVSVFEYKVTSAEYDVLWMEDLRYLYEKYNSKRGQV